MNKEEAIKAEQELRERVSEYYRVRDAKLKAPGHKDVWEWQLYEGNIYNLHDK